ncbi:MAG: glycosyltransferase family 2 protein [Elusimicrobia bacterium]|nr:glycosyltransferase family 2 protein [Elusimicrobiota bacterium]
MKDLTVLVPLLNEEEAIEIFLQATRPVLDGLDLSYKYLFVDDGSTDKTLDIIKSHAAKDGNIDYISLSRNFGKEAALLCGIKKAGSKAIIPMDIDLQDPPDLIPAFVEKWKEGYNMVLGVRKNRDSDSFLKKFLSTWFYKVHNLFARRPIPENTGDFRLLDSNVAEAIKQINESTLFMKGLFNWTGFKTASVEYVRPERSAGQTKWSYWKLWNFALDGIFNASTIPLRLWTYFGASAALLSFLYASFIVLKVIIFGKDVPGYASLAVLILFFGGVQLMSIGILGEYIGRIFAEVKHRPAYIIKEEKFNA